MRNTLKENASSERRAMTEAQETIGSLLNKQIELLQRIYKEVDDLQIQLAPVSLTEDCDNREEPISCQEPTCSPLVSVVRDHNRQLRYLAQRLQMIKNSLEV